MGVLHGGPTNVLGGSFEATHCEGGSQVDLEAPPPQGDVSGIAAHTQLSWLDARNLHTSFLYHLHHTRTCYITADWIGTQWRICCCFGHLHSVLWLHICYFTVGMVAFFMANTHILQFCLIITVLETFTSYCTSWSHKKFYRQHSPCNYVFITRQIQNSFFTPGVWYTSEWRKCE